MNSRRKHDCLLKAKGVQVERIFDDIKDVVFAELIPRESTDVLFIGKHLCGSATCMALKAISTLRKARPTM